MNHMTYRDIKMHVMAQTNNDADDLADFLPFLGRYINDAYDLLTVAWAGKHVGVDEAYPPLYGDGDMPNLPGWTHGAIGDEATYLVYRNGNVEKQRRGLLYHQRFEEIRARIYAEGGSRGKRDRFVNVTDRNRFHTTESRAEAYSPFE